MDLGINPLNKIILIYRVKTFEIQILSFRIDRTKDSQWLIFWKAPSFWGLPPENKSVARGWVK